MSENDKKINEQLDKAFRDSKPVSATDCTGLMQGLAPGDEADISAKMYNIAPCQSEKSSKKIQPKGSGSNDRKR